MFGLISRYDRTNGMTSWQWIILHQPGALHHCRRADARDKASKWFTAYILFFALSDGTTPDFGPSSRGFVRDLIGIDINEPHDMEMVVWRGIYSVIHRQNLNFQIMNFYGLLHHVRAWDPADHVLVNVFPWPAGYPDAILNTSRAM